MIDEDGFFFQSVFPKLPSLINGVKNLAVKYGVKAASAFGKIFSKVPQKVIGHYPAYIKMSTKLGTKPFSIPLEHWNKMTKAQQWAANRLFLDRAIKKGSEFVLATPIKNIRQNSDLIKEINYLKLNGYKFNNNGTKLIK